MSESVLLLPVVRRKLMSDEVQNLVTRASPERKLNRTVWLHAFVKREIGWVTDKPSEPFLCVTCGELNACVPPF